MQVEIVVVAEDVLPDQQDLYDRQTYLAVQELSRAVEMGCGISIFTHSAPGRIRKRFDDFAERYPNLVRLVPLAQPSLTLFSAMCLASQHKADGEWLLACSIWDQVCPEALQQLMKPSRSDEIGTALFGHGWSIAGSKTGLTPADFQLLQKGVTQGVMPRLNRLALRTGYLRELKAEAEEASTRRDIWSDEKWFDYILKQATTRELIRVVPEVAILSPLPKTRPQDTALELCQNLAHWSGTDRAAQLEMHLIRLDQELRYHNPGDTPEIIEALTRLRKNLSWRERREFSHYAGLGPYGLKSLIHNKQHDLSMMLMQYALFLERERNAVLEQEVWGLRRDLQCALPGPEYMRMLYERMRF